MHGEKKNNNKMLVKEVCVLQEIYSDRLANGWDDKRWGKMIKHIAYAIYLGEQIAIASWCYSVIKLELMII